MGDFDSMYPKNPVELVVLDGIRILWELGGDGGGDGAVVELKGSTER